MEKDKDLVQVLEACERLGMTVNKDFGTVELDPGEEYDCRDRRVLEHVFVKILGNMKWSLTYQNYWWSIDDEKHHRMSWTPWEKLPIEACELYLQQNTF